MENTSSPSPRLQETRWAPKFFTIWSGQAFSLLGSSLVQFALVWWLTQKTGSATVLATSSLVALLPQIVLGPFVGTLVDRWNRRLIMIVADSAIAAATAVLIFLFLGGHVQVWHIYVILLLRSLGGAFHQPAMQASTTLMVPNSQLARVAGMNQTLQGVISIFAPPLGALLISLFPTGQVLLVDIFTAALAVIPLLFIGIPQPPRREAEKPGMGERSSYWQELKEGFTYVFHWKGLFGLILMAMILNFLLSPASSLLPLLVRKAFNGGAEQLAFVESAFGAGVILGGLGLSVWGGFKKRILTTFSGIVGISLGVILGGLTPGNMFWLLLGANFILGFAQVFANGPLSAIFQSTIAPEMQGRVFSLIGAGATAMMPLSLLIAGPVSDWLGIRVWFIFGGVMCLLLCVVGYSIPAIMNIESNHQKTPQVELQPE